MIAEDLLRRCQLDEALASLEQEVRLEPENVKARIFLFQMLAVLGEWTRALSQLRVIGEFDAGTLPMVQTYCDAIQCERLRLEVFEGRRSPLVLGEPAEWMALIIEALRLRVAGHRTEARELRERAFRMAPARAGSIEGSTGVVTFEWIADADERLGPVLEAVIQGSYYWVPFERIAELRVEEPVDLRDLVWTPVRFVWPNGGDIVGLVPTRYPGSESSADPRIRMARRTEWLPEDGDDCRGQGQRILVTDSGDFPLLDTRKIDFETPQVASPPAAHVTAAGEEARHG